MNVVADTIAGVVGKVIDLIPNQAAKDAANLQLQTLLQTGELAKMANATQLQLATLNASTDLDKGQLQIDNSEASSGNLFASSWRPAVGWCCVLGLLYAFLVSPLGTWSAALLGRPVAMPELDIQVLLTLLGAMLGVHGLGTLEKIKGVA